VTKRAGAARSQCIGVQPATRWAAFEAKLRAALPEAPHVGVTGELDAVLAAVLRDRRLDPLGHIDGLVERRRQPCRGE
jgi:hypothetical protein